MFPHMKAITLMRIETIGVASVLTLGKKRRVKITGSYLIVKRFDR